MHHKSHPRPEHRPSTGAALSLSLSPLSSACFPSAVHVENICIGGPSAPPPLIYSHPSILSPHVFLISCRKRQVPIVNMERCRRISGSELRGLPEHIFVHCEKSRRGTGRPCAAAGLICPKHVQIGRPTQTIKVEWRFCSTRHFCLTESTWPPSREQTGHKGEDAGPLC